MEGPKEDGTFFRCLTHSSHLVSARVLLRTHTGTGIKSLTLKHFPPTVVRQVPKINKIKLRFRLSACERAPSFPVVVIVFSGSSVPSSPSSRLEGPRRVLYVTSML